MHRSLFVWGVDVESDHGRRLTVAIDGPAGAGKSTVARRVAQALGYAYIDSGAMYRAATLHCLKKGVNVEEISAVEAAVKEIDLAFERQGGGFRVILDGDDVTEAIRSTEVGKAVSDVAKAPGVRELLVARQRAMASGGGVVMDGRDIGTTVLPDAEVKVYLTASPEERARRRRAELIERGLAVSFEEVLESIRRRDEIDSTREVSPLMKAWDAVEIDSTGKSIDEVVAKILALCRKEGEASCST